VRPLLVVGIEYKIHKVMGVEKTYIEERILITRMHRERKQRFMSVGSLSTSRPHAASAISTLTCRVHKCQA